MFNSEVMDKPLELVTPRRWWQFRSKRVVHGVWFIQQIDQDIGTRILLVDQLSRLKTSEYTG